MKYLFVVPYFVPAYSYGGPVKGVYARAVHLAARGHEVTVCTSDVLDAHGRYQGPLHEVREGVEVVRFRVLSNFLAYRFNYFRVWGYRKWLSQHAGDYDFIFLHDFFTQFTADGARICASAGVPYSVTPHGVLNPTRVEAKRWIKQFFLARKRHILKHAHFAVALTREEELVLQGHIDHKRIERIPNGVDLQEFVGTEVFRGRFRNRFGLENHPLVLYVGRIHRIKGIDILVRAFSKVLQKIPGARLAIVGPDDGHLSSVKQVIAAEGVGDAVLFTGLQQGDTLKEALADAELYAFTSYDEGLPMSVLEAAASGLPCVISRYCNVPEVAEAGAGYVLENEPQQVAERIITLLQDEKLRTAMGRRGQKMVKEYFTWEAVVERLETLTGATA